MNMRFCVFGLMLSLAAVTAALAQAPEPPGPEEAAAAPADAAKVPSADFLGPKLYTFQIVGTVQDALRDLEKLTGWHFMIVGKGPDRARNDQPVALDFSDATLDVILLGLCEQAGLVYDAPMGGNFVQLRAGDIKQDPRPSVMVGDFIIRVTDVRVSTQRSFVLRWGDRFSGEPDTNESLIISLAICPRSLNAMYQLGALAPGIKATTEKGGALEFPSGASKGVFYSSRFMPSRFDAIAPIPQQVQLPVPTDGSLSLSRLEGELQIFPDAKRVTVEMAADSKGKTFELGKETVSVEDWIQQGPNLQVTIRRTSPPQPATPAAGAKVRLEEAATQRVLSVSRAYGPEQAQVVAIDKDGAEHPAQTISMSGGGDGSWKAQYGFQGVGEVATIRYTSIIRGSAEQQLPFVIENIPLP